MTPSELAAAIEAGTMTITRLPAARPQRWHLTMTRVGGSRSSVKGSDPRGTKVTGTTKRPRRNRRGAWSACD